ncbi:MAG: glycosyltransferase [Ruminococcaceae bacterium]|nr:glycosyltransferase [Oscillospiraceae bacterium]
MNTVLNICNIIIAVFGALYAYRTVITVVGFFFTKKFPRTDAKHKYAVTIAARNEEAVIAKLIESIKRQDYPSEYLTIFVVADNCTDKTAELARAAGAVCYERFDKEHCTKGYALQYLYKCIERDYGIESFEGYFVFDADNLLKKDFVSRMNDAFHSGEKLITSYRNTKNIDDGFIAASYALHWLRTIRFESRGRSVLGISVRIQGTGFLFASELVKDGWNYLTLTEDREFTCDAIAAGNTVTYQHEAQFYDEQPVDMHTVFRQRIRWSKGHLMAFTMFFTRLWGCVFRGKGWQNKASALDFQLTNFPYGMCLIPLKILKAVLLVLLAAAGTPWWSLVWIVFQTLIFEHFAVIPMGLLLFITERKRLQKISLWRILWYSLMFCTFGIIGDITMWIAAFTHVTWKPIPHKADTSIKELEKRI